MYQIANILKEMLKTGNFLHRGQFLSAIMNPFTFFFFQTGCLRKVWNKNSKIELILF
jgi:hypothetical protein